MGDLSLLVTLVTLVTAGCVQDEEEEPAGPTPVVRVTQSSSC